MTTIDTAALRALMEKATKGPFEYCEKYGGGYVVVPSGHECFPINYFCSMSEEDRPPEDDAANGRLVAAALNALPALLDAYEELERMKVPCSLKAGETINEARARIGLPPIPDATKLEA